MLLQKLSKTPFETMKHLAKDRQWMESDRNGEELLEFMDLPENFGDDRDEDLLSALAKVTYHLRKNNNESHRQFFNRWEQAMRKVKEHGVTLPEKYVGFLLVNALQLSEGDIKALLNYSRGSISPVDVRDWIRKHETKLQLAHVGVDRKSGSTSTKSSTASANYIVNEPYDPEIEEEINMVEDALRDLQGDEDEDGEGLGDGTGSGLESILEEHEAAEVLSTILQQKKKTYQQTVKAKKSKELSRGYGKGRGKSLSVTGTGVPPFREGQFKMTIEQLKKVTKCGICHKVGHWHRECPERGQPSSKETHHLETEQKRSSADTSNMPVLPKVT